MSLLVERPEQNPNYEPERQCCGYTISILRCILFLFLGSVFLIGSVFLPAHIRIYILRYILAGIGCLLIGLFDILALHKPDYLGGNPSATNLTPLIIGCILFGIPMCLDHKKMFIVGGIIISIVTLIAYLVYIKNDTDPNVSCLCFKPWVYKPKFIGYPPHGYPPYGAPPVPQGYPPYGASAPTYRYPQQGSYPPYGAPPPQSYAPQGYPQYGQNPQGHPPPPQQHQMTQGYPNQIAPQMPPKM